MNRNARAGMAALFTLTIALTPTLTNANGQVGHLATSRVSPTASPTAPPTAPPCGAGRKTEHFPTTDLWDVIRIISADYKLRLQPGISLPHTLIQADLINYTCEQALAFLDGLTLRFVPFGPQDAPVFMVYTSSDASRVSGNLQLLQFHHIAVDESLKKAVTEGLPDGTYVEQVAASNSLMVGSSDPAVIARAANLVAMLDISPGPSTDYVRLKYRSPIDIAAKLKDSGIQGLTLTPDEADHTIILHGAPADVATMKSLIEERDVPTRAVLLLVTVYEYQPRNDSDNVGLDFQGASVGSGGASGSSSSGGTQLLTINSVQYNASFNAAVISGQAKILDKPKLQGLDTQPLHIQVGETIFLTPLGGNGIGPATLPLPYDTGVVGDVTPSIGQGFVTLDANLQVSDVGPLLAGQPTVEKQQIHEVVRVRDGEELIIGGLMRETDVHSIQKVPILGDIPILGEFFKDRVRTAVQLELAFAIKPVILDPVTESGSGAKPAPQPSNTPLPSAIYCNGPCPP